MLEKRTSVDGLDWGPDYHNIHSQTLTKLASECHTPEALVEVMEKLTPRPEGRYILLNALGAYEYWGENRNADAFPEWSLKGEAPPKSVLDIIKHKVEGKFPNWRTPSAGTYGYKTFVTDAHVYQLHENKDPAKAIGDVIASAYNDRMHRVELIIFVYEARHPELVRKIDSDEPVPFSMGAKLAWDMCSVCLNPASKRPDYCDHLRHSLRQTLPDGRKVFAYNFFPKFFDISYVRTPADKSAWGLRKVASLAGPLKLPKQINFPKVADLVKRESQSAPAANLGTSPINKKLTDFLLSKAKSKYSACPEDPALIRKAKDFKLSKVLASLTSMGILLRPGEVTKLSSGNAEGIPTKFDMKDVDDNIVRKMASFVGERSYYDPHFTKQTRSVGRSVSSTEVPGECFTAYTSYLESIDFEKLADWLDTSVVAEAALNSESFIGKFAGLTAPKSDTPLWLPFFATILQVNKLNN